MAYFSKIYSSDLPHRAKAVYMYLKDRSNTDGQCYPAIGTIAKELNLSRITVEWALSFQPSVLPWRHAISFLESPVKVRKVVKTTLSGDRKDRIVGCTQTVSGYI